MNDGQAELDELLAAARASATAKAYQSDLADFSAWAAEAGMACLPADPATVARYLAARSRTLKPATLERRLAALAHFHRQAGHPFDLRHPLIVGVRAGIRRTRGTAQEGKRALGSGELRAVLATIPSDLAGIRDRCILALGFAGALRRSELSALDLADLRPTSDGLVLCLRRGKSDQEGRSELRAISYGSSSACPVKATVAWMQRARLADGALLRPVDQVGRLGAGRLSGAAIAVIVKRRVAEAVRRGALDVTAAEAAAFVAAVSAHSLRAGAITTAAANGASEWEIMRHTGHKRTETVRRYIRLGTLFDHNLGGKLGL